jgi:hypothetical protein
LRKNKNREIINKHAWGICKSQPCFVWIHFECIILEGIHTKLQALGGVWQNSSREAPLFFIKKNGFSRKTFGRVLLEELEPEPERSPAKQSLS